MPPPREYKGRAVSAGFSVASDYKWFRNETRHVPVATVVSVGVDLHRNERELRTAAGAIR